MNPVRALRDRVGGTWRVLVKELSAFGIVGGATFLLDIGLFQVLYAKVGLDAVLAKLLSTLVSMTVAYLGHRYWSFSHRARTGVRREYLLFAAVNAVTLVLGLAVVAFVRYPLGQTDALVLQAANIGSIALGTLIRFLSYRRWIFPAHPEPAPVGGDGLRRSSEVAPAGPPPATAG
ncbi:GtrA family protein [Geodermatophilus sp. SYSU D00691]